MYIWSLWRKAIMYLGNFDHILKKNSTQIDTLC